MTRPLKKQVPYNVLAFQLGLVKCFERDNNPYGECIEYRLDRWW